MKFVLLINLKILAFANSFLLNITEHENFSANKYENVGIFIFISRENFMLSWVEHEKSFITSGPGRMDRNLIVPTTHASFQQKKKYLHFQVEKNTFSRAFLPDPEYVNLEFPPLVF